MEVIVRYATEFGSSTSIMNVEKIPSFTKKFKILSVEPIINK
jgi:hypothetical protein